MNLLFIILFTIAFSAFFSGVEIAFITANKLKVELDRGKGLISAQIISRLFQNPSRFLGAMLLGNNIALVVYSLAMAAVLEPLFLRLLPGSFHSEILVFLSQTIISTLIILITAEFLPKVLFRLNPNGALNFFAVPIYLLYLFLYPLIYIFIGTAEFVLKQLFGFRRKSQGYEFSAIDLDEYISSFLNPESVNSDDEHEVQMIHNIRDFHTVKLRECMVPRNEIAAIEETDQLETLRNLFIESGHSKILIYRESIDNIVGYSHLYDLYSNPKSVKSIVRPVVIVPETITADKVLNTLINEHRSVAVVVDEFGGTAGMATVEDLIEEILGEIDDEFDTEERIEKRISDNEFVFSGRLEIDYLNREYKLQLPESDEYETLAGFIIHYHRDIPAKSESLVIGQYSFIILSASNTRIDQVQLKVLT
jgi:putative hemolysin